MNGAPRVAIIMRDVLLALVPGTAVYTWFFGPGVLRNLAVAIAACMLFEALALRWRERAVGSGLRDGSAIVTGALLALALPPQLPAALVLVGSGFAMLLGKHVFGGLGQNIFNPAMLGYVVLLISFPLEMTQWPVLAGAPTPDGWSSATPLDHLRTQLTLGLTRSEIETSAAGVAAWAWINIAFLLGGAVLLARRVIHWRIPLGLLAGLGGMSLLFWLGDSDRYASPAFHWLAGGTMLGAFFIATDPVTAPGTPRGRLLYGAGIGALIYVIRTWGGYPDAVAFAVLLFNMATPTLDQHTRPRAFGETRERRP